MHSPPDEQVEAGKIAAGAVELGRELCRCPIDGAILDQYLETYIRDHGGRPALKGYKPPFTDLTYEHTICLALDNQVVHGVPVSLVSPARVITIDLVVEYGGWYADTARTFTYEAGEPARTFVLASQALFRGAQAAIIQDQPIALFGATIESIARQTGMGVIGEYCGHGISQEIHTPPQVLNYGTPGGDRFEVGKSYAVEPVLAYNPSYKLETDKDGWTISADCLASHNEDTIFVGQDEIVNLTRESNE